MRKQVSISNEEKRTEIINRLIAFNVYKKEGKHLFELPLSDLEYEYKRVLDDTHPHSELTSIRWIHSNL